MDPLSVLLTVPYPLFPIFCSLIYPLVAPEYTEPRCISNVKIVPLRITSVAF
ncbi:hypothetical protein M595_2312, partial [Lyngbya aestuarii BL J]